MKTFYKTGFLLCLLFLLACANDDDTNKEEEAFSNLNDTTTSAIETTIPHVEITQSNSGITLYLSVTDQDGMPLENFTLGNYIIELIVGGVSQILAQNEVNLTELDELTNNNPLAVATTMDYSGSMSPENITDMEVALKSFVNVKDAKDRMAVIKFASVVDLVQDFTTDENLLLDAINNTPFIGSSTAFYSSCELGLDEASQESDVLPLVIGFTDGVDNNSTTNMSALITKAQNLSIPIYTLGFGDADEMSLETLADETGGRYFYAPSGDEILNLYQLINGQLKKLYILNWDINEASGTEIMIHLTTQYTAANGTYNSDAYKTLTVQ